MDPGTPNRHADRAAPEKSRPQGFSLSRLCRERPVAAAAAVAVACETATLLARFGLGLESARDTALTVGAVTFGLRIHHGYLGLILAAVARRGSPLFALGAGLAASDIFHHFVVLAFVTGSPQFDLFYPPPGGREFR